MEQDAAHASGGRADPAAHWDESHVAKAPALPLVVLLHAQPHIAKQIHFTSHHSGEDAGLLGE